MNYFQIKIVNSTTPFVSTAASKGSFILDFPNLDAGELRIVRYQATGLNSGVSPLFVSFSGGAFNTSPIISASNDQNFYRGSSLEFMLPVNYDPSGNGNSAWEFQNPIVIATGDNLTTGSRVIQYTINDISGAPYNLGALMLVLDYIPVSRYNPIPGDRQVKQKEFSELISRNQSFRSTDNYDSLVPRNGYSNM